jgi:hypothetical protein
MAATEPLHGLTFALLHLTCLRLLAQSVPHHLAATALTIYGTVGLGVPTALLTLASGQLYAHFDAHGFWVMAAFCSAAFPVARTLRQPAWVAGHCTWANARGAMTQRTKQPAKFFQHPIAEASAMAARQSPCRPECDCCMSSATLWATVIQQLSYSMPDHHHRRRHSSRRRILGTGIEIRAL